MSERYADTLGRGLSFGKRWDVEVASSGSIGVTAGLDVLGRDLAFALNQELGSVRGTRLTPDDRNNIKSTVEDIATEDTRVDRIIKPIEVGSRRDGDIVTATVTLEVVAATGDRAEFILPL